MQIMCQRLYTEMKQTSHIVIFIATLVTHFFLTLRIRTIFKMILSDEKKNRFSKSELQG